MLLSRSNKPDLGSEAQAAVEQMRQRGACREGSVLRRLSVRSPAAPTLPGSILYVVHNSPARWRGAASGLFKPITHSVGPQQGCGQDTRDLAQAACSPLP